MDAIRKQRPAISQEDLGLGPCGASSTSLFAILCNNPNWAWLKSDVACDTAEMGTAGGIYKWVEAQYCAKSWL